MPSPSPTAVPADLADKPAAEQLELLWAAVSAEPYETPYPRKQPGGWARRKLFSVGYNKGSFDHEGEELADGRRKLVHRYGTCARVTLRITAESPYTGLVASGASGLMRISDAAGAKAIVPALAMKLFADGTAPRNYLAMPYGQPRTDHWLSTPLANAAQPASDFGTKLVQRSFEKTARALGGKRLYGTYLPLHDLCDVTADGAAVAEPAVPDRLELHATDAALAMVGDDPDWRVQLEPIAPGTALFEVRVAEGIDAPTVSLGELILESPFVASAYGDDQLFFRHHVGPT